MATKALGKWIDELVASSGKYAHLETGEGVLRQGRISGYQMRQLVLNGEAVEILTALELNGDPSDAVPLDRIVKITIDA